MSDEKPKIIRTFQQRLELDAALRSLGEVSDSSEGQARAAEIAEQYGERVIPALLSHLDAPNPQLRGGLGQLAVLLDREKVVEALRGAAYNRSLSDLSRMTAITILERFLSLEPEEGMYAGMASPEEMALQSLHEVLAEAPQNPLVYLDYLGQLSQEPPDVLMTMVQATRRLKGVAGVELLRLFAQEAFLPAAEEALQILGMIAEPAAAEALHALVPNLPPSLRPKAERSLQKLRLRGVSMTLPPPPPAEARCLASPPDGRGQQLLMFVTPAEQAERVDFLQVIADDETGIAEASGAYGLPVASLPEPLPPRSLHDLNTAEGQYQPLLLETSFDYGRRRLLAGLKQGWIAKNATPLPYRLLNLLVWRWQKPQPAAQLPDPPATIPETVLPFFQHRAMSMWFLQSEAIVQAAERFLYGRGEATPEALDRLAQSILQRELAADEGLVARVRQRLEALHEWLILSDDITAAELVGSAAVTLEEAPERHPLLLQMAGTGLRIALINLAGELPPLEI